MSNVSKLVTVTFSRPNGHHWDHIVFGDTAEISAYCESYNQREGTTSELDSVESPQDVNFADVKILPPVPVKKPVEFIRLIKSNGGLCGLIIDTQAKQLNAFEGIPTNAKFAPNSQADNQALISFLQSINDSLPE